MKYLRNVTDLDKFLSNCMHHKPSRDDDVPSPQTTHTTPTRAAMANLFNLCSTKIPSNWDVVDAVLVTEVAQDRRGSLNVVQQHGLEVMSSAMTASR